MALLVGVFGCDGDAVMSALKGASAFVSTYSRRDGETPTSELAQSGFAAAKAVISGMSPDEAAAEANSALLYANRTKVKVGKVNYSAPVLSQDGDSVLRHFYN